MLNKLKKIVGSVRFWIVTLAWGSAYLAGIETDGFSLLDLLDSISKWLATVAGIGTLDSIATKFGASIKK